MCSEKGDSRGALIHMGYTREFRKFTMTLQALASTLAQA
jgi:hypothetical protein